MDQSTESLPRPALPDGFDKLTLSGEAAEAALRDLVERREAIAFELGLVEASIEVVLASVCGASDDSQDVETYDGSLGVTRQFVDAHEAPVGQLQWLDDLDKHFTPPDDPGSVNGVRWGSGALIADDLFLTAGHCFDQSGRGWQRPSRRGSLISPREIATRMRVNFNYQLDGKSGTMRPDIRFPVVGLLEYREAGLDYAIVQLGPDEHGRLPGRVFGSLRVAASDLTNPGAMLCVIQHPHRQGKKINAGTMLNNRAGLLTYNNIDTGAGSSGSPVLSAASGQIVGIHLKGGCRPEGGVNRGLAIGMIREVSNVLRKFGA